MKKVGLIAGLACLLTVGGVYATWIYATDGAGTVTESLLPQMAAKGDPTDKGVIHVKTSTLTLVIDQKAEGDYTPVMKLDGYVSVWFVPATGASEDIIQNGIPLQISVTQSANWNYDPSKLDDTKPSEDKPIFTVESGLLDVNGGNPVKHSEADPYKITAETILERNIISFNVTEKIDTVEKWNYFQAQLVNTNKFTVTVSEKN